jgi:hypothetical protein
MPSGMKMSIAQEGREALAGSFLDGEREQRIATVAVAVAGAGP